MNMPVFGNQQELIYISLVRIRDVVWKNCRERWMIGTDRERERESKKKSVLSPWLDDDEYFIKQTNQQTNKKIPKQTNKKFMLLFIYLFIYLFV